MKCFTRKLYNSFLIYSLIGNFISEGHFFTFKMSEEFFDSNRFMFLIANINCGKTISFVYFNRVKKGRTNQLLNIETYI